jgi:HAD superfamily hydrolase (TIGR01484 family)
LENKEHKSETKGYKLFNDYKEVIKEQVNDLRVVYTDLDGTLLNDQGCLVKDVSGKYYVEVVKLLARVAKKNWDLVLVSGRNRVQMRHNAQLMGASNYIAELGSELVHNLGEKVYVTFDTKKYPYNIINCGKDLINIINIFKENFPHKIDSNLDWSKDRAYNALFFGEIDLDKANCVLEKNGYEGLSLVDNGFSKLVNLDLDVKTLHIYNLIPRGVDKSTAIKLDKNMRNFTTENCIALGDSAEDLKMAKEVKFFFLMKDAIERDQNILESLQGFNNVFVTKQKMNRGWVEIISYLLR